MVTKPNQASYTGALRSKKMKKLSVFLFICISTLFLSCVSNSSGKKETFDDLEINSEENENNKEVDIRIQQCIKINGNIPGYRIIVTNWGCRESRQTSSAALRLMCRPRS